MALSPDQIAQYTAANKSGFNYKLPDGTVIGTSAPNPQYAATVDTLALINGKASAPISSDLLDLARSMNTNPGAYTYDPNTAVVNSQAALSNTSRDTLAPNANPNAALQAPGALGGNPVTTINTDYQLKPGETIAAYNARIAAGNPNLPAPGTTSSTGVSNTSVAGKDYTAPSTINSSTLGGTSSLAFQQQPALSTTSSTLGLSADGQMQATPQEQKQHTLADYIQTLNTDVAGKAQYQNEQNAAQGVQEKLRLVNDFSSQLKIVQLEAANIQQQTQTGEGVTTAIDQRQKAEALRLNNVKSLGIYAQLQMAQGNLSSAQDAANAAVAAKFDPIEAALAAAKANLETIRNDPLTSLQDKNRALVGQQQVAAQQAAVASQKEAASKIWDIYSGAAESGLTNASTLSSIYNAKTPEEALLLAAKAGVFLKPAPGGESAPTVKSINGVDMQWNKMTGQWESIGGGVPIAADAKQKTQDQLSFLINTASQASALAGASGASGLSRTVGDWLIGDTKFRQLEALTNTLRTNVLTLMTDPGVKKFFGPQMSNNDVALMTAAGTTLNPAQQSPAQMTSEIARLNDLFKRMQAAVNSGGTTPQTTTLNSAPGSNPLGI